jgi:hypothetical protein
VEVAIKRYILVHFCTFLSVIYAVMVAMCVAVLTRVPRTIALAHEYLAISDLIVCAR